MRIAVNTRFLLKDKLEGMGIYTLEIVKRMVLNHPEDEFIFFFDRAYDKKFVFAHNVTPVVVYPSARHPILWDIWFELSLPYYLKKYKADVFFSTDGHLSLKTNVPTVMCLHDLAYLHYPKMVSSRVLSYYQKRIPQFIEKANKIICVSKFVKQDIQKHFRQVDSNKIVAIHNACSKTNFDSKLSKKETLGKYSSGRAYIFYVGAIHPRKNIKTLIEAFELFASENKEVDLLIAGRLAWQNDALKNIYENSAVKDRIKLLGYVSDESLTSILSHAMLFVYPSLLEGFGLPILEAFHAEVPVISSNVTSMPEVAGNAAILVDPKSKKELAQAIKSLVDSKELRSALVEKGKVQREKFSWDRAAGKVYELISIEGKK